MSFFHKKIILEAKSNTRFKSCIKIRGEHRVPYNFVRHEIYEKLRKYLHHNKGLKLQGNYEDEYWYAVFEKNKEPSLKFKIQETPPPRRKTWKNGYEEWDESYPFALFNIYINVFIKKSMFGMMKKYDHTHHSDSIRDEFIHHLGF